MKQPLRLVIAALVTAVLAAAALVVTSCAPATVAAPATSSPPPASYPPPPAEPLSTAVLPFGLAAQTAARYPHLASRNVGLGIHNMIVERLYETGWFRFVEEKKEVIDDLLERQWMAASGGIDAASAVQYGRLVGARYVLYGEVFDFSASRSGGGGKTEVAVQVRLVDVETSEYIPASGRGVYQSANERFDSTEEFARSTAGRATEQALATATTFLLQRLSSSSRR